MVKGFLIFFLETLWNMMVGNQAEVCYRVSPNDNTRVIVKMLNFGSGDRRFVFITKPITYYRYSGFLRKKARVYRIEVIEEGKPMIESKVYIIPELCSRIFSQTLVPHFCAINCIVSILKDGANGI